MIDGGHDFSLMDSMLQRDESSLLIWIKLVRSGTGPR